MAKQMAMRDRLGGKRFVDGGDNLVERGSRLRRGLAVRGQIEREHAAPRWCDSIERMAERTPAVEFGGKAMQQHERIARAFAQPDAVQRLNPWAACAQLCSEFAFGAFARDVRYRLRRAQR